MVTWASCKIGLCFCDVSSLYGLMPPLCKLCSILRNYCIDYSILDLADLERQLWRNVVLHGISLMPEITTL